MPADLTNQSMARRQRLLVVEDEREITDLLRRYFSGQGFDVSIASEGASMRAILQSEPIDVVLLDLGLPGEDGFALTRFLRETWKGAVIIITGRGESVDRIVGLELGADDYVTKPFDLRELLARVRSVLRRTAVAETPRSDSTGKLRFAGFTLNTGARTLTDPAGVDVPLTTGEYDLLCVFLARPDRVLSRDDLMSHLHGRDAGPYDRAIDVGVGRLRRKLEDDVAQPALIKAVRGVGYLFSARVERE